MYVKKKKNRHRTTSHIFKNYIQSRIAYYQTYLAPLLQH